MRFRTPVYGYNYITQYAKPLLEGRTGLRPQETEEGICVAAHGSTRDGQFLSGLTRLPSGLLLAESHFLPVAPGVVCDYPSEVFEIDDDTITYYSGDRLQHFNVAPINEAPDQADDLTNGIRKGVRSILSSMVEADVLDDALAPQEPRCSSILSDMVMSRPVSPALAVVAHRLLMAPESAMHRS